MAGLTPVLGAWLQRGEFFGVRGQRLFVIREGRGPVLMLLHGYPTSSWDWHRIWTPLTAHFTLVAPDLLGMGFSAKPAHHSYSLNAQADLVDALAQRLGIHHMHVLAHDLGVTVAQELLARRQADGSLPRIDSLVLLNGGVCPEAYEPRPIQRLLISPLGRWLGPRIPQRSFERAITSLFAPGSPPAQDLLDNFWALISHGHGRRVTHQVGKLWHERQALRDRLVAPLVEGAVPVRLINGALDPNSGAHMARRYREVVPDADIVSLPEVGHWPQLEAPDAVVRAMLAFAPLQRAAPQAAPMFGTSVPAG